MEQYIPKSIVAARIEGLVKCEETWMEKQGYTEYHQGLRDAYNHILSFVNTLEVKKEVDLEKEIMKYQREIYDRDTTVRDVAKHFFKLGMQVQKGG